MAKVIPFIDNLRSTLGRLPTRGDIQKARGNIKTASSSEEYPEPVVTPKVPVFKYKNPATENDIEYWRKFTDEGTMRHYDDLMNVLDNIEKMNSKEDIRNFINQLKDTTTYKVNPGIQIWVGDLESEYYGPTKYDLSYPVDLMRHQTAKAKNAFDSGYRSYNSK